MSAIEVGAMCSSLPPDSVRLLQALACFLAVATAAPAKVQAGELPKIGVMEWSSCDQQGLMAPSGPFLEVMGALGHVLGKSFVLECRSAGGTYDGQLQAARDLAGIPVDVIVSDNQPAAHAARSATETIPIVSLISGDPVAAGLAESLAAPGGNLTGVSYYATELTAKRLELLIELLPDLERLAVLANPDLSYLPFERDTEQAARRFGVDAPVYHVRREADLEAAFSRMRADGAEAVFVLPDVMLAKASPRIAVLALEHGLPSMAWGSWFTRAGVLMAYSTDYGVLMRRLAHFVDQVLRGADPAVLPIEQPATYQLSINLRTAEALDVEVPPGILLLAEEVVE